jgi:hypothetical protein
MPQPLLLLLLLTMQLLLFLQLLLLPPLTPLLTNGLLGLVQLLLQAQQDAVHTLLKAARSNKLMGQLQIVNTTVHQTC